MLAEGAEVAVDVELERAAVGLRVLVGRPDQDEDDVPLRDALPVELDVALGHPEHPAGGADHLIAVISPGDPGPSAAAFRALAERR